ncbi:MAG: type IX secretion system sortase PorU [Salinivirgaceae bacterium]|nr:type IX secretion system sortase PorU [Salinivirgaceae bacterium]
MVRLLISFLLILTTFVTSAQTDAVDSALSPTTNSLLSTGRWFMIKVDTSGVYRLTYDELRKIGLENPAETRIFSYGGRTLPMYCGEPVPDDLNEIPTLKETGGDGVFGSGDYLIFYAQGPVVLDYDSKDEMFVHSHHYYSDYIYLLLTSDLGAGKPMLLATKTDVEPETTVNEYDAYAYFGRDKYNLVASGRRWYDTKLVVNSADSARFRFGDINLSESVKCIAAAAGRKADQTTAYFCYKYRGREVSWSYVNLAYTDYRYASYDVSSFKFKPQSSDIWLSFSLVSSSATSEGHISWIGLNARELLTYNGRQQLHFRDSRSVSASAVRFAIDNGGNTPRVLDITNPTNPVVVETATDGAATSFVVQPKDTIREFVAFDSRNLLTPIMSGADLGEVANQNLHGAATPDMLIVTPPDFVQQAEELAELHRAIDKLKVLVVTQQQVFNEFSGGTPDVAAVRNFARMLYKRNEGFRYLLLFGDGTYDNRNITGANANLLLTMQSEEAESTDNSFVSDDFFGMLDEGEGEFYGTLDIAVGRLPAANSSEAQTVVDKIRRHLTGRDPGGWCNTIAIIADDEENGDFVNDAEGICNVIGRTSPEYNINKIYLDAHTQVSGSSGATYPEVTELIKKQFANGADIIEYIGHGGTRKMAHESIFMLQDANALANAGRMPVFIAASCEVGRFDDHQFTSLGETLVKNPKGGAIAALVTTRVVYNSSNIELSRNIFAQGVSHGLRVGDIVKHAKNATGGLTTVNKRKFVLLGDPAISLAHPHNKNAVVSRINGRPVGAPQDTINAIDTVTIEGYVCDAAGNVLNSDGVVYATVFDKKTTVSTRGNDSKSPVIDFKIQNSVLYQGKASIIDGFYQFRFIMPKDIDYSFGRGRISLYAVADTVEAVGYSDNIIIGGTPLNAEILDFDGPEIQLFMTDTNFVDGYTVGSNPIVIARLFDESGINTTGNGIGHDIVAMVDYDMQTAVVLNDCYEGYIDKYNSGELRFNLYGLAEGEHTLTLKAWDIYNNPSEAEIQFVVRGSDKAAIGEVYNFPNPASTDTYFYINHNQTDNIVDVTITIYDMQGRTVGRVSETRGVGETAPIHWQCQRGGRQLDRGIYIYKAEISGTAGKSSKTGKMIIERQ